MPNSSRANSDSSVSLLSSKPLVFDGLIIMWPIGVFTAERWLTTADIIASWLALSWPQLLNISWLVSPSLAYLNAFPKLFAERCFRILITQPMPFLVKLFWPADFLADDLAADLRPFGFLVPAFCKRIDFFAAASADLRRPWPWLIWLWIDWALMILPQLVKGDMS